MKIAVSGADGFLGSHVLEQLREKENIEVVGVTLFPDAVEERFASWDELAIVPANLATMRESPALANVDVYLACAFPRTTKVDGLAEGLDFVYGSLGLILDRGCRTVVNVSSQSVYDPHRTAPAKETDSVLLTSTYAATKYCVELSVARMCRDAGVPYTNVRMASLIGPGFDQRFPNKMAKAAVETGIITVSDDGSRYGFLDVHDAAEGLIRLCISNSAVWPEVLNLGSNSSYNSSRIADVIQEECLSKGIICEKTISMNSWKNELPSNTAVDSHIFCSLVAWEEQKTLTETIGDIISYIRDYAF